MNNNNNNNVVCHSRLTTYPTRAEIPAFQRGIVGEGFPEGGGMVQELLA